MVPWLICLGLCALGRLYHTTRVCTAFGGSADVFSAAIVGHNFLSTMSYTATAATHYHRPPEYCSSRHHASSFPSSPRGRRKAPQEEEWRDSLTLRTQHHPPSSLPRHINDAASGIKVAAGFTLGRERNQLPLAPSHSLSCILPPAFEFDPKPCEQPYNETKETEANEGRPLIA